MGILDIKTKQYFRNKEHFADLFNFKLHNGKQLIHSEDLKPFDSTEVIVPYGNQAEQPIQLYRDNVSVWASMQDSHTAYVILGIESQAHVHYAMPVRNMMYDSANYAGQVRFAAASYRGKEKEAQTSLSRAEFLSGFRRDDRLMPVITVVVLFNEEAWDGPRTIHEMLSVRDRNLLQFIPDYRINLVSPAELAENEYKKFRTSLGQVLEYIRVSRDKEKLERLLHQDPHYCSIDRESADLINTATNSRLIFEEGAEEINMCKAIDDIREEAIAKGIAEGRIETIAANVKSVMESFHVSVEKAMDSLKVPAEARPELLRMIQK